MLSIKKITINGKEEECSGINLVLGANNSGKSTFLKEVNDTAFGINIHPTVPLHWVDNLTLKRKYTREYAERIIPNAYAQAYDESLGFKLVDFAGFKENINNTIYTSQLHDQVRALDNAETEYISKRVPSFPETQDDQLNLFLSNLAVSMETTSARLTANFQTLINDLGSPSSQDMMHYLLTHPAKLNEINEHVKKVFNIEITFDNLQHGNKMLRIMPDAPITGATNLRETSDKWNAVSAPVSNQGDGIKAYLKILFCLLEPSNEIVLIDEPETFLHPPHRRELGRLVAELARENKKQVFIATHDSEFLGGLMSASPMNAKVFYLKSEKGKNTHSTYSLADIKNLTTHKSNFVSERILQSFFYQKTILCEDESDRTIYEVTAVNYFPGRVQNINFVGLGGNGDVIKIQKKLSGLGLRCGFIVDFDFLTDQQCPYADTDLSAPHNAFRSAFQSAVVKKRFTRKDTKFGGLKFLKTVDATIYDAAVKAIEAYRAKDMHIVPDGEIESLTGGRGNPKDAIPYIQERRRTAVAGFLKQVLTV